MRLDEEFDVIVDVEKGRFKVHVKCIYVSSQIYRFVVKGGEREMVLRTDFPFVYSKRKRSAPIQWKIESGEKPSSGVALAMMFDKLDSYLKADLNKVH